MKKEKEFAFSKNDLAATLLTLAIAIAGSVTAHIAQELHKQPKEALSLSSTACYLVATTLFVVLLYRRHRSTDIPMFLLCLGGFFIFGSIVLFRVMAILGV